MGRGGAWGEVEHGERWSMGGGAWGHRQMLTLVLRWSMGTQANADFGFLIW